MMPVRKDGNSRLLRGGCAWTQAEIEQNLGEKKWEKQDVAKKYWGKKCITRKRELSPNWPEARCSIIYNQQS